MRTTAEIAPHGARPAISLRPAPSCEPPFDDELEPTVWATAHQLALDWPSPPPEAAAAADRAPSRGHAGAPASGGLPPIDSRWLTGPRPRDAASAGSGPRGAAAVAHGQPPGHRQAVAGASADAKLAVRRFVRMCVEVLNGHRPPAHLRRLSRPAEAAEVVAQALVGTYRVAEMRKQSSRRPPRRPLPVAVIRLRLCEPRPGAVEAAVAMVIGERTWAMALRLELHQDIWSATTLRLI
jgi:hypothetical protein